MPGRRESGAEMVHMERSGSVTGGPCIRTLLLHTFSHRREVPGAFRIPVCRNPGGESLSSVWEDKSRNCKPLLELHDDMVADFAIPSCGRPLHVRRDLLERKRLDTREG
jgi:hypothetical protein